MIRGSSLIHGSGLRAWVLLPEYGLHPLGILYGPAPMSFAPQGGLT